MFQNLSYISDQDFKDIRELIDYLFAIQDGDILFLSKKNCGTNALL